MQKKKNFLAQLVQKYKLNTSCDTLLTNVNHKIYWLSIEKFSPQTDIRDYYKENSKWKCTSLNSSAKWFLCKMMTRQKTIFPSCLALIFISRESFSTDFLWIIDNFIKKKFFFLTNSRLENGFEREWKILWHKQWNFTS